MVCLAGAGSPICEIQFCDASPNERGRPQAMHAHYAQHRTFEAPENPVEEEDVDIEFFTDQDLQQPSCAAPRHAKASDTQACTRRGSAAADPPAVGMLAGFEEVDAASLAALLGQEASTMCDIVFCDEDSRPAAGATYPCSPVPFSFFLFIV